MSRAFTKFTPAILLLALGSCGAGKPPNSQNHGRGSVDSATLAELAIGSDSFKNGQPIPVSYTCDGKGDTPLLHWGDPPGGTQSLALVVDDPDAPNGTFHHWGVFDIPSTARSIGGIQHEGTEVRNDFGSIGYKGPCPPKGHGSHHYHFKLYALDVAKLGLSSNSKVSDVEKQALSHAIAKGELIGTYERR